MRRADDRSVEPNERRSAAQYLARCLACVAALATVPAAALDARYTDGDGDLVADTPSKTVDPPTLIFAYSPGEDPATYPRTWDEFLRHLEKTTGKHVRFFRVQSNDAEIEAMRSGRLHIAAFGTGAVPVAVNCAGFVPFAIMGGDDGILRYEMEFITYPHSGIATVGDLKGRKVAFTSRSSNSGFKLPSLLLRNEFGLEAERDYDPVFAGRHDSAVLGVAHKDYDAAAIANEVMHRMMASGVVKRDEIVTIYKSMSFPTAGFGLAHNLDPGLATRIREAFFSFPWAGSGLEKEFSNLGASKFVPITYVKDWAVVRDVDASLGVRYSCR
jgi:phosphonate transport system substrate-binding protein